MYVLGGWAGGNIFLNDMYALDMDSMQWAKVLAAEHRHGASSSSPPYMRSNPQLPIHAHTPPHSSSVSRWARDLTRAFWFGQTLNVGVGARDPVYETDATILSWPRHASSFSS